MLGRLRHGFWFVVEFAFAEKELVSPDGERLGGEQGDIGGFGGGKGGGEFSRVGVGGGFDGGFIDI